jgi:hypothetical protein
LEELRLDIPGDAAELPMDIVVSFLKRLPKSLIKLYIEHWKDPQIDNLPAGELFGTLTGVKELTISSCRQGLDQRVMHALALTEQDHQVKNMQDLSSLTIWNKNGLMPSESVEHLMKLIKARGNHGKLLLIKFRHLANLQCLPNDFDKQTALAKCVKLELIRVDKRVEV